jgi:hypothetical protein
VAAASVAVQLTEQKMQDELWALLQRRFPAAMVERERDYVDLTVTTAKGRMLFELKATTSARQAIRLALGQLLDYAFFHDVGRELQLVIVGQGPGTAATDRYLAYLTKQFKLPIRYRQYVLSSRSFEL